MAAVESLEVCISRLPATLQNQSVTNLHEISESFTDWESVLPYLGLNEVQEESIFEDHNKAARRRLAALRTWSTTHGKNATFKTLLESFYRANRMDMVEKVIEVARGETQKQAHATTGGRISYIRQLIIGSVALAGFSVIVMYVILQSPKPDPWNQLTTVLDERNTDREPTGEKRHCLIDQEEQETTGGQEQEEDRYYSVSKDTTFTSKSEHKQGPLPDGVYQDCKDAFMKGHTTSGVYTIKPDNQPTFQVYCDMDTDGGGWTVFQRRMDGSVDFERDWVNYEQGFGTPTREHWLGLKNIHRLTVSAPQELRIDLEAHDNKKCFAMYDSFSVAGAADKYRLHVSGYSGAAGDSLAWDSGMQFSTRNQDNDIHRNSNCAVVHRGGWWYARCHDSNLNGFYHSGGHSSYADGVNWYDWKGYYYSIKHTEMKLRKKK